MSLSSLVATDPRTFDVISADLFDTVLLRDLSSERERFAEISAVVSAALVRQHRSVSPHALAGIRRALHELAYRAVSIERPEADATLASMLSLQSLLLGDREALVGLLRAAEFEVERRRLSPNRPLLTVLGRFAATGKRVVAVSDTYYATDDLVDLIQTIVGSNPFDRIYGSSDLQATKHAGGLFAEVARQEGVETSRILHFGDNLQADVMMARAAGCQAIHLPRSATIRTARLARAALARAIPSRSARA